MKKILVLGAGLVAKPLVEYLLNHGFFVTVASAEDKGAGKLAAEHKNGKLIKFSIDDLKKLSSLVKKSDIVVSLLPYTHHVTVAKLSIEYKKNMVTTSYVSKEMRALDPAAKKTGVIILNEVGLDPGIDHMSVMKIIHEIQEKGGTVESLFSYCGGLPAPEANDNPWGYKFSWSPRGVVMAAKNGARYLEDGRIVDVDPKNLFSSYWKSEISMLENYEVYPNRDSLGYIDLYGIKGTKSMIRGTIRNKGWCDTWKVLADLGFLDDEKKYDLAGFTYGKFAEKLASDSGYDIKKINPEIRKRFEWLGIFRDEKIFLKNGSAMDLLSDMLGAKLIYKKGERDMTILCHEFIAAYKSGREKISSYLIDYGLPSGDSSMSRTVGIPAAIGVRMILDGEIKLKGVHIPVVEEIYTPILAELAKAGIVCKEERAKL